ncbi:MAG: ABC transporter permease [Deltaproteobacteria bacterium]|nr:ABC transporter permease [Deltaproteobacteria bacterium]
MNVIWRRLLAALPVVWGVSTLVFFALHMLPGDPAAVIAGERATAANLEAIRQQYHLDQPVMVQYGRFMADLARGDLRISIAAGMPVSRLIADRYLATLWLALAGLAFSILFALPLGVLAARFRGTWIDRMLLGVSLLGVSLPTFWVGPVLILLFAVHLGLLPMGGFDSSASVILPAVTLGLALAAGLSRIVRVSMLDVLSADFVRTARAKGLAERAVIWTHALRAALLPVISVLGLQFGVLLGGAIITEKVFAWPGIGTLLINGILQRDFPVVQGVIIVISTTYVLVNVLTDIAYGAADPRIRSGGKGGGG